MFVFSVIIPVYNKAPHIERALRSVLSQTFQSFEAIVVDDGSTDNGAEVVKGLKDSRIRLIHQQNAGVSVARNRGIEEAKSDLIAFLDADDEWKPEYLETVLRLKEKFPNAGAYATAYEIHGLNGKVRIPKFKTLSTTFYEGMLPNYFKSVASGESPVFTSAVCVYKYVFDTIGKFQIGEPLGEDLDMWGRIALKYPIAFSLQICAVYYTDTANKSSRIFKVKDNLPFVKTVQKAINNGQVPTVMLSDLKKYIINEQLRVIKQLVFLGNLKKAKEILAECELSRFCLQKLWWRMWTILPIRLLRLAWKIKTVANILHKSFDLRKHRIN